MVTVKVSELLKMAKDLTDGGYEYVDIDELEEDDDCPKCLHFDAYDGFGGGTDFEEINHVDVSADYKSEQGLTP